MIAFEDSGIGILFRNLEISENEMPLLQKALTHRSFGTSSDDNNERLEFLGDSILSMVMSNYLFSRLPAAPEGSLAKLRAAIVCEGSLARAARRLGYGAFIRLSKGEEATGGRDRESILSDCFEAILACIYIAKGYPIASRFALDALNEEIEDVLNGTLGVDFKTMLQEVLQRNGGSAPTYQVVGESGPDHRKSFTVEVNHEGNVLGQGTGSSKKRAEQIAASEALRKLHVDLVG